MLEESVSLFFSYCLFECAYIMNGVSKIMSKIFVVFNNKIILKKKEILLAWIHFVHIMIACK
jgi:hypothetical protein